MSKPDLPKEVWEKIDPTQPWLEQLHALAEEDERISVWLTETFSQSPALMSLKDPTPIDSAAIKSSRQTLR